MEQRRHPAHSGSHPKTATNGFMSQSPFFSVVIPTYNRADLLRHALESVFRQEFRNFEVIVVDDGSTEDLSCVIADYAERVTFLRQKNAGPSAARNRAISVASGKYVAFLDSDDLWFPWTLDIYRVVIDETGTPAFLAGCPRVFHELDQISGMERKPMDFLAFSDYLGGGDLWRWFGVSSFVIRTDILNACKGFSPNMWFGEDADLALRLGTAPGFVQIVSPATFGYRQASTGQLTGNWKPQHPSAETLIANERSSQYPGADLRARERQRIISRHARPVALRLLREQEFVGAWKLYLSLLPWNISLGQWKFVLGFPTWAAWRKAMHLVACPRLRRLRHHPITIDEGSSYGQRLSNAPADGNQP